MAQQDESPRELYVITPDDAGGVEAQGASEDGQAGAGGTSLQDIAPTLLFVFGMLLLIAVLLRALRKNTKKARVQARAEPSERIQQIRGDAAARAAIDGFSADAEELTRRLGAILDNKAARLELLIEEADQRLAALNKAGAASGVTTRAHEPAANGFQRREPDAREAPIDPLHRRVCDLADDGLGPVEIAKRLDQPIGQVELILNLNRRRA